MLFAKGRFSNFPHSISRKFIDQEYSPGKFEPRKFTIELSNYLCFAGWCGVGCNDNSDNSFTKIGVVNTNHRRFNNPIKQITLLLNFLGLNLLTATNYEIL